MNSINGNTPEHLSVSAQAMTYDYAFSDLGFYDPFAEDGEQEFDPAAVFQAIISCYEEDKIQHDDAADRFVARTEALMMDSVFVKRFDAVQAIAAQMHMMCGEDHGLRQQIENNDFFKKHDSQDGHGHSEDSHDHHHDDDLDDDDDEDDWIVVKGRRLRRRKTKK